MKVSKLLAVAMGNHLRTILLTFQSINGYKTVKSDVENWSSVHRVRQLHIRSQDSNIYTHCLNNPRNAYCSITTGGTENLCTRHQLLTV